MTVHWQQLKQEACDMRECLIKTYYEQGWTEFGGQYMNMVKLPYVHSAQTRIKQTNQKVADYSQIHLNITTQLYKFSCSKQLHTSHLLGLVSDEITSVSSDSLQLQVLKTERVIM